MAAGETKALSYVDFEPYCEWKRDEGSETLILHLPEFKREQLRVQVNTRGVLKVSGEKTEDNNGTKRKRFEKEAKIPESCDINDIRAKFSNGILHITMPKTPQKVSEKTPKEEIQIPSFEEPKSGQNDQGVGFESSLLKLLQKEKKKKVVLGVGIAALAVVAIGAFITYRYGAHSSSSSSSSSFSSHVDEKGHD